jgi:hypothetical protein
MKAMKNSVLCFNETQPVVHLPVTITPGDFVVKD